MVTQPCHWVHTTQEKIVISPGKIGGNITRNQYHWYGLPAIDFDAESIAAIDEKQAYGFYELEGEFIFKNTTIDKIKGALNMFDDLFGSQEIQFRLQSSFTFP